MTLAWLYKQERTPAVEAVFAQLDRTEALVPALWWLEIANALQMGIRRQRLTASERDEFLALLGALPIVTDDQTVEQAWTGVLEQSDRHALTAYDAAYLELALRRGLPLATLDRELRVAAAAEGVALLGQ